MRSPAVPPRELHIVLLGQSQVGKSAFIVKYMTKRFIGEYDSTLEETYRKDEMIDGESVSVCLMDTVECESREWHRWQTWGDLFIVVYDITCSKSLTFAEKLLERLKQQEHSEREGRRVWRLLLGNKTDLERYRVVSEEEGRRVAALHGALFAECCVAGEGRSVNEVVQRALIQLVGKKRSPSPTRLCASDSEISSSQSRKSTFSVSLRSPSRLKESSKLAYLHKSPSLSKMNKTGSKLLKLFHN
ncbi:hypothetical protein PRIPAC_75898 [Pristionchus pacificus]|nr:hypothetical protein PRIPAC_75898 [Pristionchus pacificus]